MKLLLFSLIITAALPLLAETDARSIMEQQRQRHRVPAERTDLTMVLVDDRGRERERSLTIDSRTGSDDLEKIRLQFHEPADIREVGLLTWEQAADMEDDQWLYLPARRSSKRIASSGKKNSFMGTDLAYEDLRPENLDSQSYTILREEPVEDHPCWVIEAVPDTEKEAVDSGYSRRLLWVRMDNFFTVQIHYFDRRGNHIKTLLNLNLVELPEGRWRSDESVTTTTRRGSSTIMRVTNRDLSPDFPESHFEPEALRRSIR